MTTPSTNTSKLCSPQSVGKVHRRIHPQSVGKVRILCYFSGLQLLVFFSGDNSCCLRSCQLVFPPQFDIFCPSDFFFYFQMRLLYMSEARLPLQLQHLSHVPPLDVRIKNTITILKFISKSKQDINIIYIINVFNNNG